MTRQEKDQLIDELTQVLQEKNVLYLTDASGLDAEATTLLRRESFKNNITVRVVKNTLLRKAMERVEEKNFEELYGSMEPYNSSKFFSSTRSMALRRRVFFTTRTVMLFLKLSRRKSVVASASSPEASVRYNTFFSCNTCVNSSINWSFSCRVMIR